MTLTGESENKLEEVRSKVSDVNSINDIKEFINDSLLETFSTPDFFVNNTVRDKLKVTVDSIKNCAKLSYDKINTLITEYNGGATAARKSAIERAIKDIEKTVTGSLVDYTGPNLAFNAGASRGQMDRKFNKKYNHYNELYKSAKKFIYTPDMVNCTHELGENTKSSEKLNKIFVSGGNAKYYIVGDDGNRIKPIGGKNGKYKFKMKMVGNPPEQEVEVSGIKIDGNSLILKDVSFEPSNIDMREPLTFNIAGSFHNVHGTGVNLVHMKKFEIKLSYNLLNEEKRRRQFDKYNNSLKERPIEKALEDTFTDRIRGKKYNHESERKALKEVLTNFDDRKYNDLTDAQKEKFFQRMFRGGWKNRTKGIIGSRKSPNFEEFYSAGNIRSYNTYKKWFVADDKAWNKDPKNAKSETNYMGFIKDNASSTDKCKEFVCDALKKEMLDKKSNYRLICARFTEFLDEIEENKTDNIKLTKQMHKKLGKKGLKMDEGPRSIFHPRDINYMRFFVGSSKSITDQEVKVYTNQGVRGVDNQSFKYGLDINVGGDHNINLKINTSDGKKFEMSAGEPSVLARRILKNDTIWPSKARVHICFNIYKAMIAMAKDKNISLTYRDGKKLKEIYEKNGDIIIEEKINKGNTLSTKTIFSEKVFSGVNDFDRGGVDEDDIGVLNRGIEKLGEHFNKYMNLYHKNYRKATERRLGGLLHSPSRPTLPTCFWLSPIKKILNCSKKTTTNFDFDAPIKTNIGGKDIEVDFKKNKFTITIDKKKYSSRDLGKLLNLRSGGDRIFEGIDRELSGEIYRKLIKELLRKNRKIARTSFGVKDSLTGNLYVLDKNGRFGYISQEDLKKSRGHVMKGIISRLKKSGYLKDKNLFGNDEINYNLIAEGSFEEKELLENPILMQKFLKVMNRRMAVIF